jgi:hypothetical protein
MNITVSDALPKLAIARHIAQLSTFDGSVSYQFLVNPEAEKIENIAVYQTLPVLGTGQPLVKYQYSESKFSIPDIKLWSYGNDRDLTSPLATLTAWTKPDPTQGLPKLLKFSWGQRQIPRCYIASFSYEVVQWRGGAPTQAQGSLELILAPEPPATVLEAADELTQREQEEYQKLLQAEFPDKKISVGLDSLVTADGQPLGTIRELLGDKAAPGVP